MVAETSRFSQEKTLNGINAYILRSFNSEKYFNKPGKFMEENFHRRESSKLHVPKLHIQDIFYTKFFTMGIRGLTKLTQFFDRHIIDGIYK